MRASMVQLTVAAALFAACEREAARPAMMKPGAATERQELRPNAGGSTRDFGGACPACNDPVAERIALDDPGPLGFSAEQVLALVEGAHVGAARWRRPCEPGACVTDEEECPKPAPSFGAATTALRVEVERAADEATAVLCPEREPSRECPESLSIPVRVTLVTDDGVLDERFDWAISAIHADYTSVDGVLEDVSGSLFSALPAQATVEWALRTNDEGTEASIHILAPQPPSDDPPREVLVQLEPTTEQGDDCRLAIEMLPAD
jgi:hypothetical protein